MISTIVSVVIYICSIFLMKSVLNGIELFSSSSFPIALFIVGMAWGPPFAYEFIKRCMYPSEEQKIMKQVYIDDVK